jgi:20S proteasome subunit alpha 6
MSSRFLYNRPVPVARVVNAIADKAQVNTQHYGRRPYGVGLLVAGVDETGPHLWEFQPSGMVLEYRGAAIGARSQSAKTYLERNYESFGDATREELVLHGLTALRDTLAQDKELTTANVSLAIVGKDEKFKLYDGDEVAEWLQKLGNTQSSRGSRGAAAAPPAPEAAAPAGDSMDVDA